MIPLTRLKDMIGITKLLFITEICYPLLLSSVYWNGMLLSSLVLCRQQCEINCHNYQCQIPLFMEDSDEELAQIILSASGENSDSLTEDEDL